VVTPLRPAPITVVLTPETFDSFREARTLLREGAIGHTT
jgi:hypothetical protein